MKKQTTTTQRTTNQAKATTMASRQAAHNAGIHARKQGKAATTNPYAAGSSASIFWMGGWRNAPAPSAYHVAITAACITPQK